MSMNGTQLIKVDWRRAVFRWIIDARPTAIFQLHVDARTLTDH